MRRGTAWTAEWRSRRERVHGMLRALFAPATHPLSNPGPVAQMELPYRSALHPVARHVAPAGPGGDPVAPAPDVAIAVPRPVARHPDPSDPRRRHRLHDRGGWRRADGHPDADRDP